MIILIGYRGTGKSTIGRLLASELQCPFVDADELLESRAGRTIRDIFATDGEQCFRDLEAEICAELCSQKGIVLSTGGGVVLRESNRQYLRSADVVVWLTAAAETIHDRLERDPTTGERRPNLRSGGLQEIRELLQFREPLYRECATLQFDTTSRSPETIVADILAVCPTKPFFSTFRG